MPNFNKVVLLGRLTRDPDFKQLANDNAVANFSLAINSSYTPKNGGDKIDKTEFIECEAFANKAKIISEYFSKGKNILVEGRLKQDTWEDNGNKRSKVVVVVENFEFIDSKKNEDNQEDERPVTPPSNQKNTGRGTKPPF